MAMITPVKMPESPYARKPRVGSITKYPLSGSAPFKDSDKDGVVDFIDCRKNDPKKQGLWSFVKHQASKTAQKVSKAYKEYKAAEPERRKKELARLQHKRAIVEERAKIETARAKIRKTRPPIFGTPTKGKTLSFDNNPFDPTRPSGWYWGTGQQPKEKVVKKRRKRKK